MATGKLTIIANAMAREVTVDDNGLASGVSYIDKNTIRDNHVRARIVVVAASACESARLLLNSKSSKFPHGLANSTGVVGKYLTDSTGTGVTGFIPRMMDNHPHNEDGTGGAHLFMPWWADNKKLDFPRGYHIEIGGGRRMPGAGFLGNIHAYTGVESSGTPISFGGYGRKLKRDYRRVYGATVSFAGRGEMIPNEHSYMEIDPRLVDKWGIPVPRFHFKWSDYEINQSKHMQETFRSIIHEMGGMPLSEMPTAATNYDLAPGGRIIHEIGVVRMGNDPNTSALNKFCQAHDAKNLFVADGGPFVSQPDKNCTWTILALAMRTANYIADQRKAGTISIDGSEARIGHGSDAADCSARRRSRPGSRGPRPKPRRRPPPRRRPAAPRLYAGPRSSRSFSAHTSTRRCACWWTSSSRKTSAPAAPPTPASPSSWTSSWSTSRGGRPRCGAGSGGSTRSARSATTSASSNARTRSARLFSTTSRGHRRRSRNSSTASPSSTAFATSLRPGSGPARWA